MPDAASPPGTERITRQDVAHVARLARLRLTDEELERTTTQLAAILDHAADVASLDLDDVPPTSHPIPIENVFRDDLPGPTLDREEVLAAAPAREGAGFQVPAILGEEP